MSRLVFAFRSPPKVISGLAGDVNALAARQRGNESVARDAPQVPVTVNVVAVAGHRAGLRVEIPFAVNPIERGRGDVVDGAVPIQALPLRLEHGIHINLRPAGGGVLARRDDGT